MSSSELLIARAKMPKYTFFVPWTRYKYVEQMLNNINSIYFRHNETEVVFYVDTDDKRLWQRLIDWSILNQYVFNGIKMIKSSNKQPADYDGTPESLHSVIDRRSKIVRMKEDSKQYISDTSVLFGIEDDTQVPSMAFETLRRLLDNPNIAYAQGVQQGRWGEPILGAWRLDNVEDPKAIETVPFEHETDVIEIDGGGMFCYATPTHLYKEHKYYSWPAEPGGPDATYGFELRKMGYRCVMDFKLICPHLTDQGVLIPHPQNSALLKWEKSGEKWVRS